MSLMTLGLSALNTFAQDARYSSRKALDWQYEQDKMALQNHYAIEAENRANAYNDPSAQVARLRRAGINPQMAVSDAGVQGSISSAPNGGAPSANESRFDILGTMLQMKKTESDIKNQTEVSKSQANLNDALADRARGQEGRDKESWQDTLRIIKADANIKENQATISKFDAMIKQMTFADDISKSHLQVQQMIEDIKRSQEQGKINEQQAKLLIATTAQKWAEWAYTSEKAITENQSRDANIENTKSQTAKNKAETKTIDETRDATILNLLGDIGIKEVNIERMWQDLSDLRNGVAVGSDIKSEFVRFLQRRLGTDQSIDGASHGVGQYRLPALLRNFLDEYEKKFDGKK